MPNLPSVRNYMGLGPPTFGTVFYAPGQANGDNQRNTLDDALKLAQDIGAGLVLCDGSEGQPVAPALAGGVPYDFKNISLGLGYWTDSYAFTLDVEDGATFVRLENVVTSLVINNKSASPVMSFTDAAEIHLVDAAKIVTDAAGTAPFFALTSGAGTLILYLGLACALDGQGNHAVLSAVAGSATGITLGPLASIGTNTLTGAGSIAVTRGLGAVIWATVDATQTGASALTLDPP